MPAFSLTSLLNEQSRAEADSGREFAIEHIDIDLVLPDERNFYSVEQEGVERLAASIQLAGLEQNLVVRPTESGKYILIAGHRRLAALQLLVEAGNDRFKKVPCKVERDRSEVGELLNRLRLIEGNATIRRLSDYEQAQQASELKQILLALKQNGVKIPGRLRNLIADALGTSPSRIGRMENVQNNLSPVFQEDFQEGRINLSVANELAGMPESQQRAVYEEYQETGRLTLNEVRERRTPSEARTLPPELPATSTPALYPESPVPESPAEESEPEQVEPTRCIEAVSCPCCRGGFDPLECNEETLDYFHSGARHIICPGCNARLTVTAMVTWIAEWSADEREGVED